MEKPNLIPIRRFKEFQNTNAWEQRKLDEEVEFYSGLTYSPNDVSESGTFVLRSSNVKNGEIVGADNVFVNSEVVNSNNVKEEDIIVVVRNGSRSLIGKHARIKKRMDKTVIGAFMTGIRTRQSSFINALLDTQNFKSEVDKNLGATINQITNGMFRDMQFMFPNTQEQRQIGNFFNQLDQLIILQQCKLEKTKALKSAYLSEMFPAEGECEPKRRFAGFTQSWEQRKLGEVSNSFEYGLNARATSFDGVNKYIRITDIDDKSKLFSNSALTSPDMDLSNADNYLLRNGDILFARTGASVGKTYHYKESDGKVYYAGFLIRARINQDFDSEFVFQNTLTPKYDNFIKLTSQRSGQPGVNAQEYAGFNLLVPTLEEQQKIGIFFKALDSTIALQQRKLKKLQNLKKAYLNDMFV